MRVDIWKVKVASADHHGVPAVYELNGALIATSFEATVEFVYQDCS